MLKRYLPILKAIYKESKFGAFIREDSINVKTSAPFKEGALWLAQNDYIERKLMLDGTSPAYYLCRISDKGAAYLSSRQDRKMSIVTMIFAILTFFLTLIGFLKPLS